LKDAAAKELMLAEETAMLDRVTMFLFSSFLFNLK